MNSNENPNPVQPSAENEAPAAKPDGHLAENFCGGVMDGARALLAAC